METSTPGIRGFRGDDDVQILIDLIETLQDLLLSLASHFETVSLLFSRSGKVAPNLAGRHGYDSESNHESTQNQMLFD